MAILESCLLKRDAKFSFVSHPPSKGNGIFLFFSFFLFLSYGVEPNLARSQANGIRQTFLNFQPRKSKKKKKNLVLLKSSFDQFGAADIDGALDVTIVVLEEAPAIDNQHLINH